MSRTDAQAASFAAAWEAFLARGDIVIDEGREGWARGRAQYLAFLVRVEDAAAQRYVVDTIERIAGIPGVEAYPDWYWHVTVKGAGFQVIKRSAGDDILRQDVSRLASRAKRVFAETPAFDVELGPVNAFAEAVVLEVRDGGAVRALNTRLLEQVEGIGRYPFDGAPFLPHVSIARYTSNEGLAELRERLASLRSEGEARPRFQARRVELVKAWLTEEPPDLDTLATYALAGAAR